MNKMKLKQKTFYKPILFGISAGALLLVLYFTVMAITQTSLSVAFRQLYSLRFWVIPLVITFGIQVGVYMYIKDCNRKQMVGSKQTAVSTAASSTAMLACCAHHVVDILPIIGLSVFATFLAKYQVWFFGLGIISNLVGIGILMLQLKKARAQ